MNQLGEKQALAFSTTTQLIKLFKSLINYTILDNRARCMSGIKPYKRTSIERYYITNIFLIGSFYAMIKKEDLDNDTNLTIQKVLLTSVNVSINYAVNDLLPKQKKELNNDLFNLFKGIDFSEDIKILESKKFENISKLSSNFCEWHSKTKKTDSHNKIYITGQHYGNIVKFTKVLTSNDSKLELLDNEMNREFIYLGSLLKIKAPVNKVLEYIFEDKVIKLEKL